MKYQQASITRLSSAGKRLVNDGGWHPFEQGDGVWYRVSGRIVQRVTLLEEGDEKFFMEFRVIEPLHPRLFREGFREEISLEKSEAGYALTDILMKPFPAWEKVAVEMEEEGIAIEPKGSNAIAAKVHFPCCTQADLAEALLKLKAFALAAAEWTLDSADRPRGGAGGFLSLYRVTTGIVAESIAGRRAPGKARR